MDNLKDLQQRADTDINPNGAPNSIKALKHNALYKELVEKSGRNVGMPYNIVSKNNPGDLNNGECSFQQGISNSGMSFYMSNVSKDGNSMLSFFSSFKRFDYFHFKDFEGRSYIYQIKSVNIENGHTRFYIYGFSSNPNYTYPASANLPVIIEWVKNIDFEALVNGVKIDFRYKRVLKTTSKSNLDNNYAQNFYSADFLDIQGNQIKVDIAKMYTYIEYHDYFRISDHNPKLIIERWSRATKNGRWIDEDDNVVYSATSSSYKRDLTTDNSIRPSILDLNPGVSIFDFKPEQYFRTKFPIPKGKNGTNSLTKTDLGVRKLLSKGHVHLRVRLRISANGRKYFSKPIAHIKLIGHIVSHGNETHVIRYSFGGIS